MKGLLTAFTVLSFVAASSVPTIVSAQEMNHDGAMSDHGTATPDHTSPAPSTHPKAHHASHHAMHHKHAVHHKKHHKHTVKMKHHKASPAPKEG